VNPEEASALRASRPSAVFVSYNGLLDPLGGSQILPYVEGLNREAATDRRL
jgi:hypothetical protein